MSKVKIVLIVDLNTDEVEQLTLKGNINELTAGVVMLINHGYENLKGKDREFFIKKINEFTSDPEKTRKEVMETEIGDE